MIVMGKSIRQIWVKVLINKVFPSYIKEQDTPAPEMEEVKVDRKEKDEEDKREDKVPNTPPIIRFPCCPLRK